MGVSLVSLIIAAFVEGSLGVAAIIRNFRSRLCVSFAALSATLLLHDFFALLESLKEETVAGSFHSAATVLIAPSMIWLLGELTERKKVSPSAMIYLGLFIVVVALSIWDRHRVFAQWVALGVHVSLLFPVGFWLTTLFKKARLESLTRSRIRLQFVFWAGLVTLALSVTDVLSFSGVLPVASFGSLARTLYLILIFQTFVQKQLLTVEEIVAKIVLFGGVSLIISLVFWLLVLWVGDRPGLFFFNTFLTSFAVIVLFDPVRNLIARQIRRLFAHRNFMIEEELARLSQDLMGVVELKELAGRVQKAVKQSLGTDQCTVYLLDQEELSYLPVGKADAPELSASSPLVEYMSLRRGRAFVTETIENDRESFHNLKPIRFCQLCLETLRGLRSDLIIPFMHESKTVGFCAVSTGERVILSNEQMRLFGPVGRQIAQLVRSTQAFSVVRSRDKLSAIGEMAAGLAHEIKNPLGAIHGAAELLMDERTEPQRSTEKNEYLKIILDETNRLSRVLSDFLDYAKPRNKALGKCSVVSVVEHTASLALRESKVKLDIQEESAGIVLEADAEILKQVFLNLFLNAVQAMESTPDPKLTVRVRKISRRVSFPFLDSIPLFKSLEGWEKHEGLPDGGIVEVRITDNGVGIKWSEVDRIFTPFYTTKPDGTGLGLAICHRLVDSLGGSISARPNPDRGTTFIIHLPYQTKPRVSETRELVACPT